jgi:hypothetical protein
MRKTVLRYRDKDESIADKMRLILVECPRCRSSASITPCPTTESRPVDCFTPRRVVCPACSYVKEWAGNAVCFDGYGDPVRDGYFGLPLWLQTPCCGHLLWADNRFHLGVLEQFIQADLREHRLEPPFVYRTYSLVYRLPEWMIIAKHRQAVLDAIARLK